VAASIVGAVLYFGSTIGGKGEQTIHVYNGLSTTVSVDIAGNKLALGPNSAGTILLATELPKVQITSSKQTQLIDSMQVDLAPNTKHFVYNVAQAAALVQWTAVYGNVEEPEPQFLGAQSFAQLDSLDHYFTDPPESISTKGGGGVRTVLSGVSSEPEASLEILSSDQQKKQLVFAHVRYDDTHSKQFQAWVESAKQLDAQALTSIIASRLQSDANNETLMALSKSAQAAKR
jgi:hypothetical protein